jgi:Domain of unknown function (DUF4148)
MKTFAKMFTIAALIAAPVASFAQQSNGPLTRAQVRDELVQLERAGYNPGSDSNTTYPEQIQAAEGRVAAQNGQDTGVGGIAGGSTSSGGGAHTPMAPARTSGGPGSIYFGQ